MIKPAFSTVACPDWTLERTAEEGRKAGFEGVELRTFGDTSSLLPCDPALTDARKVVQTFARFGVEAWSLATSCRFDEPIRPPVIGLVISDTERSVREAQHAVDRAAQLGIPIVRVFAFEKPRLERLASASRRIADRLKLVVDRAVKKGVRIAIENGGSYARAVDLADLIDRVDSPILGACYHLTPAALAGESPELGVATLGSRLLLARIKDVRDGRPCPLGEGELPTQPFVAALVRSGFTGPLVFEWDRLWMPELAPASEVLPVAAATLFRWIDAARVPATAPAQDASAARSPQPHRAMARA